MGTADVVPGVSGGTIAFITGIYEELLQSIKSIDMDAIRLLIRLQLKSFWRKINGNFLIVLLLGIITSLLTLVQVISFLIEKHPTPLWSFFFGLIVASAMLVLRQIRKWSMGQVFGLIAGLAIAYAVTSLAPANTSNTLPYIFLSGVLAICAMILPGISGSFILLILGKYEYIIGAVRDLKLDVILVFGIGCLLGITAFSRVISWIFKKYHDITVALLSGFMLGSLNRIWPWKEAIEFRMNQHGEQVPLYEKNIMPNTYQQITGSNPELLNALLFLALGIFIVIAFERTAYWFRDPQKK